jgi:hypothetical protein
MRAVLVIARLLIASRARKRRGPPRQDATPSQVRLREAAERRLEGKERGDPGPLRRPLQAIHGL